MKPLDVLRQVRDSSLTTGERMLLMAMVLRADNDSGVVKWTGHALLAKDTGMHAESVGRMLRCLVTRGVLPAPTVEDSCNGKHINRYQLHGMVLPADDLRLVADGDPEVADDLRLGCSPSLTTSGWVADDLRLDILPSSAFKDTALPASIGIDTAQKATVPSLDDILGMSEADFRTQLNRTDLT